MENMLIAQNSLEFKNFKNQQAAGREAHNKTISYLPQKLAGQTGGTLLTEEEPLGRFSLPCVQLEVPFSPALNWHWH